MEKAIKQLGRCNAYVEIEHSGEYVIYTLVSYCTAVARVAHMHSTVVQVSLGAAAHCSASTSRHVRRFLDTYAPGFGFVIFEQSGKTPGYDYKTPILYDCMTDIFTSRVEFFTNKPDRMPYKGFCNGYTTVKGLHRG